MDVAGVNAGLVNPPMAPVERVAPVRIPPLPHIREIATVGLGLRVPARR